MPDIHKRHGGSTESRLLNCPVCHNVSDTAPDINRSSAAAERGTALHDQMEAIYNDETTLENAQQLVLEAYGQGEVEALALAHRATEKAMDTLGIDEWVNEAFFEVAADEGGSADMIFSGDKYAGVLDYKFGHQKVNNSTALAGATAPEQLFFYLDAAMNDARFADMFIGKQYRGVIIQPEVSHGPIIYHITEEELTAWREHHGNAIAISRSGSTDNPRPGSWCTYCPGAPYCSAKKAQVSKFLSAETADNQELDDAVALLEQMEAQVKAVKREIMYNLEAGVTVRGVKLVEKQARRHWIDDTAALATFKKSKLAKAVYLEPDKLRSPAQIEKAIKAAGKTYDPSDLITKSSSGLTYAPIADKRAAVAPPNKVPEVLDIRGWVRAFLTRVIVAVLCCNASCRPDVRRIKQLRERVHGLHGF